MQDDRPVVGVIDYRTGNSQSVAHALNFLGVPNRLLISPGELAGTDRIILPGVGSAGTAMTYLSEAGWPDALYNRVVEGSSPFLGICVGLQVLFETSEEQDATCLGWLPGTVRAFDEGTVRVPQMGWNQVHRGRRGRQGHGRGLPVQAAATRAAGRGMGGSVQAAAWASSARMAVSCPPLQVPVLTARSKESAICWRSVPQARCAGSPA
ncbi:imidazole glycerol phosphate synthase subunit HisH [Streptomyces albus]|uniref:imidazole glycerol phosphate synthase subunit HisH n=1 Tax=Streptomyces albus TaxID=1888 RepID=UPI000A4D131D|nr:imidazole glycerol phosphate synthase subunit HisH [Streptomyces albus]